MKAAIQTACAVLLAMLVGCASMGLATPQSFEERLGAAYSTNTAIREAAITSLDSRLISSDEAEYTLVQTRQNRPFLDATKAIAGQGDMASAEGRLTLVRNSLLQLRTYLASRGVQIQEDP